MASLAVWTDVSVASCRIALAALSCAWAVLLRWTESASVLPDDCSGPEDCFGWDACLVLVASLTGESGWGGAALAIEVSIVVTFFFLCFHIGRKAQNSRLFSKPSDVAGYDRKEQCGFL